MTLGEKIKEARKQCCLSQEQLAKRITAEKFEIGNWKYTKCAYEVKGE